MDTSKHITYGILLVALILLSVSIYSITNGLLLGNKNNVKILESWKTLLSSSESLHSANINKDQIIVLTYNSYLIHLYSLSLKNGKISWERIWNLTNKEPILPIEMKLLNNKIFITLLFKDRHHLQVLEFSNDGKQVFSNTFNFSRLIGIYDATYISERYLLISGTRYKAGYRLQYFLGILDYKTGNLSTLKIWGGKSNEVITASLILPDNRVLVLGESDQNTSNIFITDLNGNILLRHTIKGRIINYKLKTSGVYILVQNNYTYYILKLSLVNYMIKKMFIDLNFPYEYKLNDLDLIEYGPLDNYIVLCGKAYYPEKGVIAGSIFVLDNELNPIELIWVHSNKTITELTKIISANSSIYAIGYLGTTPFIIVYSFIQIRVELLSIIIEVGLIVLSILLIVVFLRRFKKSKQ